MTQAAADTTSAVVDAPAPEPKIDFASAAAEVWKDASPPVQETIETTSMDATVSRDDADTAKTAQPSERVASRIAAAKRAEQKAERERTELRAQKEAQERRQAELDAREQKLRLVEEDPVKFFEEFKADPKAFLEKLAGEHKPENVIAKETQALKAKVTELEQKLTDRDTAAQNSAARAQADSAWQEASTAFIAHVGESAEKYPHLVDELTEAQATELAFSVLTEVVGQTEDGKPITRTEAYFNEFGVYPDNDVIAEHLDGLAKARVEARSKSAWRKRGDAATTVSQTAPNGENKVPPVTGTRPRTLTSREASQRAAAPKPWSQEAADEESLRILSAALAKS